MVRVGGLGRVATIVKLIPGQQSELEIFVW
jgi:hypothetical protein